MKLIISAPRIEDGVVIAAYRSNEETYSHTFSFSAPILHVDDTISLLVKWLAIVHATYLFSIEYFTDIETEFPLSDKEVRFFEKLFFNGMAEFRYVNSIAIDTATHFIGAPNTTISPISDEHLLNGRLLLNGGGKDGLTSGLLLKKAGIDFTLFQIGSGKAQAQTSEALDKPVVSLIRSMEDRRLDGKYQGHRPTSAAIAISALIAAYVNGNRDVIASNENSANEANLEIDGISINHQYSKSYEFEKDLDDLLQTFGSSLRYFSLLRPFHELQIIKLFVSQPIDLSQSFISCNHGFRKGYWCKKCAKCAFISLAFTAIDPAKTAKIFDTELSINIPELTNHIIELVTPETQKPLECVGTLFECQLAAHSILRNTSITLSPTLRDIFEKETAQLSNDALALFMGSFNERHAIPTEEYGLVLENAKTTLLNTSV